MADTQGEIEGLDAGVDRRLVDVVYRRLRELIQEGQLRPGQRLGQDELARQFRTSRSPIREAIVRLAEDGIVVLEPHRGAFVREMTHAEMDEIYELRQVVEPFGAAKATRRATDEDVEALTRVHLELERSSGEIDLAELFRLNGEFHRMLVVPCGNRAMVEVLDSLWERQSAFHMFSAYTELEGAIARTIHEHGEILEAFRVRRPEVVHALVEAHIASARVDVAGTAPEAPSASDGTSDQVTDAPSEASLTPPGREGS